jgi:hypothetical protein
MSEASGQNHDVVVTGLFFVSAKRANCSAWSNGAGRSNSVFATVNIAVFAPIPGRAQHSGGGEPRCVQQTADGVAEIVTQDVHAAPELL